jgi:hypothetical protein
MNTPNILCDAALPWQLGFQDGATPIQEAIVSLHNYIMFYLIILGIIVFWMVSSTLLSFGANRLTDLEHSHGTVIELLWTITPAFILLAIALPSFRLLVRRKGFFIKFILLNQYFSNILGDIRLGLGENLKLNTASLLSGILGLKQLSHKYIMSLLSMVKAILPEVHWLLLSTKGEYLGCNGIFGSTRKVIIDSRRWDRSTRCVGNTLKVKSEQPKDGNRMKIATPGLPKGSNSYGNRATVVLMNKERVAAETSLIIRNYNTGSISTKKSM